MADETCFRRWLTRHKLFVAAAIVLLPTWATLLVCAVSYHPSLFTVTFHVSNVAVIALGFSIGYARRSALTRKSQS